MFSKGSHVFWIAQPGTHSLSHCWSASHRINLTAADGHLLILMTENQHGIKGINLSAQEAAFFFSVTQMCRRGAFNASCCRPIAGFRNSPSGGRAGASPGKTQCCFIQPMYEISVSNSFKYSPRGHTSSTDHLYCYCDLNQQHSNSLFYMRDKRG